MTNETLRSIAHQAITSGQKRIKDFYAYLRSAGVGREAYLDARLESVGIVKDLGGGYFRFNQNGMSLINI